ncbi:MAG: serine/threonine-protein kinase, partial [Gemmatimonadota bacterium]
MDRARWERIQALFHDAADLPDSARRAFLEKHCSDDPSLASDVLSMLEEDAHGESLLERGAAPVAHALLDQAFLPALALEHFGPYRITAPLGEGGMGVVYLAERSDLGSLAAIKILRDAWLSPARRDRFAAEQRTLAQLNHPSIARLYDANTLPDGTPWFVMEYVEGVPLTKYCADRVSGVPERLRLFRSVCEAVEHAHGHAVIHRDLKPSNILVTAGGAVKLLDFGIAKQLDSLDKPGDQTQTGLRLMTPAYAAPEQIRGGRMGIHTDVYALGVILYELLAGRLPFDLSNRSRAEAEAVLTDRNPLRPSAMGLAVANRTGGNPWVRSIGKTSWADLDVLCLTAMHKDSQRRYRTVDALIRDVDHYLNGEPLEARADTWGYRAGKFVRRNWQSVGAAAAALVVLVGLVVFYTVRLQAARNAALAEAARTDRIQRFTMSLFEGGDKSVGPADSLRVVTMVDRGLQQARSLDGEPAVQAELYETLGSIYQKLGNLSRADTLLKAALAQRRALFGGGSPEVSASLVKLGHLRADQAQFEEAEGLIREAIGPRAWTEGPRDPAGARAMFALGRVLQERGKYDSAVQASQAAVRFYAAAGSGTAELAEALGQLADAHFYSGHYPTSDSLNQQALTIYRQLYGERHPLVAAILINLGASQFDRGHYDVAERYDRQGLTIIEGFYGKDHFQTAYGLTMLGRALVAEKKYEEGVQVLERALGIRERVFGPDHPAVASTLNELGNTAMARPPRRCRGALQPHGGDLKKVYGDGTISSA